MEYPIIGVSNVFKTRRDGTDYRNFCVIERDPDWTGMKTIQITLTRGDWGKLSIETTDGEVFAKNEKKYYLDISYNRYGGIDSARIYNKG